MTTPAHSPTLVDLAARVRAGKTAPYSDLAAAVAQTEERLRALAGSIEILAASKQIKRDERQRLMVILDETRALLGEKA